MTQTLERLLLRGPLSRVLVVAVLIGIIAATGGLLAWSLTDHFGSAGEGIWWAFLRLTDPGYLGDDQGTLLRLISTAVTVLGYVVFLGALVAIMTQWLNATVTRLQHGLTPIVRKGHVVVAGWSTRTPVIVRELVASEERVERFLLRGGTRKLHVAILAEELSPGIRQELRDRLAEDWDESMITFRSGSPMRADHLARVDALGASVVILPAPAADPRAHLSPDGAVLKGLLALGALATDRGAQPPPVVSELQDERKYDLLAGAYPGQVELLASDVMVARLLAQTVRHPGSSAIYRELFSEREGAQVFVREVPDLVGLGFGEARRHFPDAIPIGILKGGTAGGGPLLNPSPDEPVEAGDAMVIIAGDFRGADPATSPIAGPPPPGPASAPDSVPDDAATRRVLLLGWNGRLPSLLREFDRPDGPRFEVDVLTRLDAGLQHEALRAAGAVPTRAIVRHRVGEKSSPSDIARLDLPGYDTIVVLASDWHESPEEADARTMLAYLVVRRALEGEPRRPGIVVELLDEENDGLLTLDPGDEVMVSSLMTSYGVSQVALRRELRAVYDELFGSEGPDFTFRSLSHYGFPDGSYSFAELEAAATRAGDLALGVRRAARVTINPPRRPSEPMAATDAVIVIVGSR